MTSPTVSVVMAAYNGAALIEETLASLSAQTMPDFEVIVVDDCSTDTTRDVVRAWPDPRVHLIEASENGGPVRARNRGFAEARGRYIAGLDHDDICLPTRFARQVAYLDANPGTVLVAAAATVFENGISRPSPLPPITSPKLIGWLLQIMNPLVWSTTMIRGEAARRLSPFTRPDRVYAEDFDLYHRLAPMGEIARIDDVLLRYRDHPGSASQRHRESMLANTSGILAAAYAPLLGDEADAASRLVAEHVMAGIAVADRATLRRLGAILTRLQSHYLQVARPGRDDAALIRWETARLWWRIVRHAMRSGNISLADAIAVRPEHLGLGHAGIDDLLLSGLIGSVRARRPVSPMLG